MLLLMLVAAPLAVRGGVAVASIFLSLVASTVFSGRRSPSGGEDPPFTSVAVFPALRGKGRRGRYPRTSPLASIARRYRAAERATAPRASLATTNPTKHP